MPNPSVALIDISRQTGKGFHSQLLVLVFQCSHQIHENKLHAFSQSKALLIGKTSVQVSKVPVRIYVLCCVILITDAILQQLGPILRLYECSNDL